jgi:hypothetical protein
MNEVTPQNEPNSNSYSILRNRELLFTSRLYSEFSCDLRRVKLKRPLTQLLGETQLYLRDVYPESYREALFKLLDLL